MATYFISPSGNDGGNGSQANPWKTLSKATSTAKTAGDIIRVLAGTYTETVGSSLSAGVSIQGDGRDTTIINSNVTGQWNQFLTLNSPQNTNGNQFITDITLNGKAPTNGNSGGTWVGLWITGRSNIVVRDCRFTNFYASAAIFDGFNVISVIN